MRKPRNVRPSWVRVNINGRRTPLAGGPLSRSGSMDARFTARVRGDVVPVLDVELIASGDGRSLVLVVTDLQTGAVVLNRTMDQ